MPGPVRREFRLSTSAFDSGSGLESIRIAPLDSPSLQTLSEDCAGDEIVSSLPWGAGFVSGPAEDDPVVPDARDEKDPPFFVFVSGPSRDDKNS